MIPIQFPAPNFKIRTNTDTQHDEIFDSIRKKWLVLTPEEWVRQNFINYLTTTLKYPLSLIAVEKGIKVGEVNKRFDIVVFNTYMQPQILVECKAPEVTLSNATIQQILSYKSVIDAPYLIVTNGHFTYGFYTQNQLVQALQSIPPYQ